MKKIFFGISLLWMALGAGAPAGAQDVILDDVETLTESEWAQIRVHFTMPVNYVSHSPKERGQLLQIFFNIVAMDTQDISLQEETRTVSATPVMPAVTVALKPPLSLNLQRDPFSLSLRFDRPVNYDVRPGEDHRSLVIYLPIVPLETKAPDRKTPDKKPIPAE